MTLCLCVFVVKRGYFEQPHCILGSSFTEEITPGSRFEPKSGLIFCGAFWPQRLDVCLDHCKGDFP